MKGRADDPSAAGPRRLLDGVLPVFHFREVHAVAIQATPQRIFAAVRGVTPAKISLFGTLFAVRRLPARLIGQRIAPFAGWRPLLAQVLAGGFVVLGEVPDQELVIGMVGQFWKPSGGTSRPVAGAGAFAAFEEPGYAKAAMNFAVNTPAGDGAGSSVRLVTETRIYLTDPASRRWFGVYWIVVRPWSALIRRMWLAAIRRRAEQG